MKIGREQLAALLLLLLGWAGQADALTCTITMTDVAFGSVDPLAGAVVDVSANLTVACSDLIFPLLDSTVGVCVYLDEGSGGSDGTTYRYMRQGVETLPFNLFKDAARTQIWGSESIFSSTGAQRIIVTLTGLLPSTGSTVVPVYGRIPAAISDRPSGSYLSTFTGGARARYSYTDTLACNGVAGTQATDTFVVTGTIISTCAVEADDLDFGSNTRLDSAVDATTQVRTSCTTGTAYAVGISAGGGSGFATRRMVHDSFPASTVSYQLYRDASHTQIWGDGTSGTVTSSGTGNGSPQGATVHGQVPAQATPRPGDYHDTAIVTVSY